MTINLSMPVNHELRPRISVVGVGGAGTNAVNNMITAHLEGVEFLACNTDAQSLAQSLTERRIQLGTSITQGLGRGRVRRSAAPLPRRRSTNCSISCSPATWCSSPPGWAAVRAPVRRR